MRWPADLCEHVVRRLHVASLSPRRVALRTYLEQLLANLYQDLIGDSTAGSYFLELADQCLAFYDVGKSSRNPNETMQGRWSPPIVNAASEFYSTRVSVPNGPTGEHRRCLDEGDFAMIAELADDLHRMHQNGPTQVPHANLKIFGAARLYLTYAALSHYSGMPIGDVPDTIRAGRLYRPTSRYERVWQAYEDVWHANLADSHRMVEPGIEVDIPIIYGHE